MPMHIPAPPRFAEACPIANVTAVFERIATTRMAGLPIVNPALRVEAHGFRRWNGEWLGALVTPWAISLMTLPGGGTLFERLRPGEQQTWAFPSGDYEFIANREDELDDYQLCSLYSPVFEFGKPDQARELAITALEALLLPVANDGCQVRVDGGTMEGADRTPLAETSVSRRSFLRAIVPGLRA